MNKNLICEALYALPGEVVVKRRKSIVIAGCTVLVGVALIVLNNMIGPISNNLQSAIVFVGGTLIVIGLLVSLTRLCGADGIPFHHGTKKFLTYEELYFDRSMWRDVVQCVDNGEVDKLLAMPHSRVPAVAVAMYRTPDTSFAAMQAFEYVELEYRPLSNLKIVSR
ncbi:MAG: hypothetical protein RSB23_07260 [Alistipes sp.]